MAAPIVGDAAISAGGQIEHLVLESVRAERPAMAENDGLSTAPVLEIDLRAVFGRDRVHALLSLFAVRTGKARTLAFICFDVTPKHLSCRRAHADAAPEQRVRQHERADDDDAAVHERAVGRRQRRAPRRAGPGWRA